MNVTCDGIKYTIEPMPFTLENMKLFWERARKYPVLFNKEVRDDFEVFINLFAGTDSAGNIFAKGIFWRVDMPEFPMVGTCYLTDIDEEERHATVHFSFFDGRVRRRLPLGKFMLRYMFKEFDFRRLNAALPEYVRPSAINYVKALGFVEEGRTRKTSYFDGKYFDTFLFGILKEEVL